MSLQARRNSLFKSSISIKSIGDSVQKFSKSLRGARKNADQAIKTIRQKNIFKRSLVRNDDLYFRKRQENIRRKDREDELEASSVQGVPKTQGSILAKSTRGFLGRMLDFIGILLIGWAIQNLPKIISGINGLIKRISSVTGILSLFVEGVQFVLGGIGTLLQNTISSLLRFDFLSQKKEIETGLESANAGLTQARQELVTSAQQFADPENYGLPEPPGFDMEPPKDEEQNDASVKTADVEKKLEDAPLVLDEKTKEVDKQLDDAAEESKQEEGEVVQGDAENIEGKENDVESFLKESEPSGGGGGEGSSTTTPSGGDVPDPQDELKKKQQELLSSNNKTNRRNRRRRNRSSSFLGTPDSVENINQSVTSNNLDTGSNRGELIASVEITDEMKAQALNPVKKNVNVSTERKSKSKIVIIEKPGKQTPSGAMPSGSSGGSKIASAVNDEKILMKMQSTSTLKFT